MSDDRKVPLTVEWLTVDAESVVAFWVKAYASPPEAWDWFYDPAKQKFVFRTLIRRAEEQTP